MWEAGNYCDKLNYNLNLNQVIALLPARCAVPLSNGSLGFTILLVFERGSNTPGKLLLFTEQPPVLALLNLFLPYYHLIIPWYLLLGSCHFSFPFFPHP
jgi:hypothetical protein